MMDPGLHSLRVWMIISTVFYLWGLLNFFFGQNALIRNINRFSERFLGDRFPAMPESTEKFWLVLTNSMMIMLVVTCIFVAVDPEKYLVMTWIILVSKFSSSAQYLYFFRKEKYFAHLVGLITDGPLFVITLIIYIRAAV